MIAAHGCCTSCRFTPVRAGSKELRHRAIAVRDCTGAGRAATRLSADVLRVACCDRNPKNTMNIGVLRVAQPSQHARTTSGVWRVAMLRRPIRARNATRLPHHAPTAYELEGSCQARRANVRQTCGHARTHAGTHQLLQESLLSPCLRRVAARVRAQKAWDNESQCVAQSPLSSAISSACKRLANAPSHAGSRP